MVDTELIHEGKSLVLSLDPCLCFYESGKPFPFPDPYVKDRVRVAEIKSDCITKRPSYLEQVSLLFEPQAFHMQNDLASITPMGVMSLTYDVH